MKKNKKEKKKMSKKKKIIIIVMVTILVLIIGGASGYFYARNRKKQIPVKVIEVLDTIEGYGYTLEDRDTEIFKEKFLELKKLLEEEKIDYEKYAKLLAELYVIDLYTIDNKTSKYDVGALEFIYPEEKEKFENKVKDSMYKLVEDNSNSKRTQELPIVKNTEIMDIKTIEYTKKDEKLKGYEVKINIEYEEKLGYDEKIILTLVKDNDKNDNKLYIVSHNVEED